MKYFLLLLAALYSIAAHTQTDSTTLHIEQFLEIVRNYHPVVKLSDLAIQKRDADITIARGGLNPSLNNVIAAKTVDNSSYYNYLHPSITIPAWYGVDISLGIENLSGYRYDPSETQGQSGYIGISIPLLKNWIIDKRRATIKQAVLYRDMSYIEQQNEVNNILLDAAICYWEWVEAYSAMEVIKKNVVVSRQRFEMVKSTYLNGERPAIDTVEAFSQYQNFEFQKNESTLKFINKGLELSTFLWTENNVPYLLPDRIIPPKAWDEEEEVQNFDISIEDLLASAKLYHPALRIYDAKIEVLQIDRKIKFQEMLPKLDFKYNHLSKGYNAFTTDGWAFQNNFQYGIKLEMPLFLSQARGEYKKAKLKISETEMVQNQKALEINTKIKAYYNEILALQNQLKLQNDMLINFKKLLNAEETLFMNGESSLFVINTRESKVLETIRKMLELKTKYYKAFYALQGSMGLLQ